MVICNIHLYQQILLEPIVGIARTAKIRASNPPILSPEETTSIRLKYYEYVCKNLKNTQKLRQYV